MTASGRKSELNKKGRSQFPKCFLGTYYFGKHLESIKEK